MIFTKPINLKVRRVLKPGAEFDHFGVVDRLVVRLLLLSVKKDLICIWACWKQSEKIHRTKNHEEVKL
jgi:hypothetical protein